MELKRLRNEKKLSQIEVAEMIGVHVNTYILWERGAGKPSPENLEKLKEVLDIKD